MASALQVRIKAANSSSARTSRRTRSASSSSGSTPLAATPVRYPREDLRTVCRVVEVVVVGRAGPASSAVKVSFPCQTPLDALHSLASLTRLPVFSAGHWASDCPKAGKAAKTARKSGGSASGGASGECYICHEGASARLSTPRIHDSDTSVLADGHWASACPQRGQGGSGTASGRGGGSNYSCYKVRVPLSLAACSLLMPVCTRSAVNVRSSALLALERSTCLVSTSRSPDLRPQKDIFRTPARTATRQGGRPAPDGVEDAALAEAGRPEGAGEAERGPSRTTGSDAAPSSLTSHVVCSVYPSALSAFVVVVSSLPTIVLQSSHRSMHRPSAQRCVQEGSFYRRMVTHRSTRPAKTTLGR